jgi:integrase
MTVRIRPFKGREGQWEVDIRFKWPDGETYRERIKAPVTSKSAAMRWGLAREQEQLLRGKRVEEERKEDTPTIEAFVPRYLDDYCRAERLKPSTITHKEQVLRSHIVPLLGRKRLDEVTNADVQRIKSHLRDRSPKTVNNVLTTLNSLLKKSVEWGAIAAMPCTVKLLKARSPEMPFYDFHDYETLVEAAANVDREVLLIVLLGGDAGLRAGEMIALEWPQVRWSRRVLTIDKSDWRGHVNAPKGGRRREVPMTDRLERTLRAHRHLRGSRVLAGREDGVTQRGLERRIERAERRANMRVSGRLHILRHTFCSHLAIRGAPAKAIQELAGHADLTTTMRYMHLSPAARDSAIKLLDEGRSRDRKRGDIVETAAS